MMGREGFGWTIPEEFNRVANMTVFETVAFVYSKIKESRLIQDIDEKGETKIDSKGEPVMIETNWFADAEDILEVV